MALASSGTISIGGSTANRSINLELNRSATASSNLNETALRNLAQRTSGSISLSHFHGKASQVDSQSIVAGYANIQYVDTYRGFWSSTYQGGWTGGAMGSVSDGTFNGKSGATIHGLYHSSFGFHFVIGGTHSNSGFTSVTVGGDTLTRASAGFGASGGYTSWYWEDYTLSTLASLPYFPSTGSSYTIVFN